MYLRRVLQKSPCNYSVGLIIGARGLEDELERYCEDTVACCCEYERVGLTSWDT